MDKIIKNIANEIQTDLNNNISETFGSLLVAYNGYQENERDGDGYLFDLYDKEDLKCCIDGGLKVEEIVKLHNDSCNGNKMPLFLFGCNYQTPKHLTLKETKNILKDCLEDVVKYMIAYPQFNSNISLYEKYATNKIIK